MHTQPDPISLPTIPRPPRQLPSLEVSCAACRRLHPAEDPLDFHPVCKRCVTGFPLTALEMDGSFPLTEEAIEQELTRTAPGNFALGYLDRGTFVVFYVGRSDSDVKGRLEEWVGAPSQFESYAPSGRASWGVHQRGTLPLNGPALAPVASAESSYTRFAYSYADSAADAYAKEWVNYDAFGGRQSLDNVRDPAPPAGAC